VTLSRGARRALYEVIEQLKSLNEIMNTPINTDSTPHTVTVAIDSSPTGTGGYVQRRGGRRHLLRAQFDSSTAASMQTSNERELCGAALNIDAAIKHNHIRQGDVVLLVLDSTTAMSYFRNWGGRRNNLLLLIVDTLRKLRNLNVVVKLKWCQSAKFKLADRQSRTRDRSDYELNNNVFNTVEQAYGKHTIDLFASHYNAKVSTYNTRFPHADAYAIDTLSQHLTEEERDTVYRNCYVNCPFYIVPDVIRWADRELTSNYTLIVPEWPTQPWWPLVATRAVEWLQLPSSPNLFVSSTSGHRPLARCTWRCFAVRMQPVPSE